MRERVEGTRRGPTAMPIIIACFKWVIDEAYIRRSSSGELDFSSVDYKISEYDRNAIEEAVRLKEDSRGKCDHGDRRGARGNQGCQGCPLPGI